MRSTPRRVLTLLASSLLLVTGCADAAAPGGPAGPATADEAMAEFDRRAAELADAWSGSVAADTWARELIALQPLTMVPEVSDEALEAAITAGWLDTAVALSSSAPADGEIIYPDGESVSTPLVSLRQAWAQVATGTPECPDPAPAPATPVPEPTGPDAPISGPALCAVAVVSNVELGAVPLATNQGPIEAPAWLFQIDGVADPLARVAVPPDRFADPPRLAGVDFPHQPGLATAQGLTEVAGGTLTYQVGVGACDTDPIPVWFETDDVIVVGGIATLEPGVDMCTDQLLLADVSINLTAPVDDRPVLATTGEALSFGRW